MAKNPILAAILSFIIPGLGEIYAGKTMMGIVLVILTIILTAAIYMVTSYAWIAYIIVWLYAIYDSYTTAKAVE
ncbi:MAG: hypothetical protein HY802_05830 [Methanobacterium sp.]|nr:hypothetical protein [Methanobacterium sp.]